MAQVIANEIPSWIIDSINKTYTLAYSAIQITDVIMDGVEYFDFTSTASTLTLADAPTLSLRVDYIAGWYSPIPALNMTTLQDMRDTVYDILRETEQDTSSYPLNLVDLFINSAQQTILSWRVVSPLTWAEASGWVLHFLNSDVYYSNVKPSTLTADATIWATTIYADTTGYPTAGYLYLWGQVIPYTGITTTTFTWCTGVLFPYITWTQVSIAFLLPTNFWSVINVIYNNKIKLPAKQYDDIFEDLNSYKGSSYQRVELTSLYESPYRVKPFYSIKDSMYMIIYQLNQSWYPIHLRYERLPTQLILPADEVIIDDDTRAKGTIPYLAVADMMYNRGEERRAGELYNFAIAKIRMMFSWYNDTSFESQNWVQYRTGKGRLNI